MGWKMNLRLEYLEKEKKTKGSNSDKYLLNRKEGEMEGNEQPGGN
jgi:hypothetical protein